MVKDAKTRVHSRSVSCRTVSSIFQHGKLSTKSSIEFQYRAIPSTFDVIINLSGRFAVFTEQPSEISNELDKESFLNPLNYKQSLQKDSLYSEYNNSLYERNCTV